jgi:hypothetical protein
LNKKIFFNLLFLLSLFWFVLWVWFISFNTRPWLNSFGAAAFTLTGFLLGVIYFFSFYEWYKLIKEETKIWKKRLSTVALVLLIIFVSHWLIRGVLWVGNWMGNAYGIAFWLFVGFILSGFVLYTNDRLFRRVKELFV